MFDIFHGEVEVTPPKKKDKQIPTGQGGRSDRGGRGGRGGGGGCGGGGGGKISLNANTKIAQTPVKGQNCHMQFRKGSDWSVYCSTRIGQI